MRVRVRIDELPSGAGAYQVDKRLVGALRMDLAGVRLLWTNLPVLLPVPLEAHEGSALAHELQGFGCSVDVVDVPDGSVVPCEKHAHLASAGRCDSCGAEVCVVCQRRGAGLCENCVHKASRKKRNAKIRISFLLVILAVVSIFAWKETRRRSVDWTETQQVAVVLLTPNGEALDSGLVNEFKRRATDVEDQLSREADAYGKTNAPVEITVFGPIAQVGEPPAPPEQQSALDLLKFNWALGNFADEQDSLAQVSANQFDVRLYVSATQTNGHLQAVEGISQELGEIGFVRAQFSQAGIDFAWFVVLHEFFHTRGATDKYNSLGYAKDPEGLADPDLDPRYPQEGTEIMARGRPLEPGREEIPGPVETWTVGEWTAEEIGWVSP